MKKLTLFTAVIFLFAFSSCRQEDDAGPQTLIDEVDLSSEATMDLNYEEVDLIVEAGMQGLDVAGRAGRDAMIACATITNDTENKVLTIDFGDGCEGPGGRVRSGKIIIAYSSPRYEPGATRTTTFEDFFVDDVKVEGTRTIENISEIGGMPTFSITLTGGKLTFPDSTFATREASRTRIWVRATVPSEDESKVVESASGTNRDGQSYSMTTLDTLVFSRSCRAARVFIPVSGVKEFNTGDDEAVVDYGDGTCDNEVTVSLNGAEPVTRVITPRGRRR